MEEPLQSLVYYACVANGAAIVAECTDGAAELSSLVSKWLQKIPPFHRRFSQTFKRRMLLCLIENPLVYCAVVDEALEKSKAYSFLEQARDEFKKLLKCRELYADVEGLEPHSLDHDFEPVFRQLAGEFTGFPLKDPVEEDPALPPETSLDLELPFPSPMTPVNNGDEDYTPQTKKKRGRSFIAWLGRSKQERKRQDQGNMMNEQMLEPNGHKALDKGQNLEVVVDANNQPLQDSQRRNLNGRDQQHAQRIWSHSVRIVLLFDVVVCAILFGIWLGVCGGVSCVK